MLPIGFLIVSPNEGGKYYGLVILYCLLQIIYELDLYLDRSQDMLNNAQFQGFCYRLAQSQLVACSVYTCTSLSSVKSVA